MRMTTSSLPPAVGMVATRSSIVPFEHLKRILPSCGLRFSEMSSLAMILSRCTSALRCGAGDLHELLAVAVDAQADRRRASSGRWARCGCRRRPCERVDDDLVGQLHDAAVGLVELGLVLALLVVDSTFALLAERVEDLRPVGAPRRSSSALAVDSRDVGQDLVRHAPPGTRSAERGSSPGSRRGASGPRGLRPRPARPAFRSSGAHAVLLPDVGGDALLQLRGDGLRAVVVEPRE